MNCTLIIFVTPHSDTWIRDMNDSKRCEGPPASTEYHNINKTSCTDAAPPATLLRWCS
jgi:hypothetical protein